MFAALRSRLHPLLRWPRRIAALLCLLLAAVTAAGQNSPASVRPSPATDHLAPGEVAVPVPVRAGPAGYLHVGDRVSLYPTAGGADEAPVAASTSAVSTAPLAQGVTVLAVPSGRQLPGAESVTVLVATDRTAAARIATRTAGTFLAVLDEYP